MNMVIVLGNGFDLDLGWNTSYKAFYDQHDGWKNHQTDEDDLFQYVIKNTPGNWFDFERTLHEYAIHRSTVPAEKFIKVRDIQDYINFKSQLSKFISECSKNTINKESYAYRLLEAFIKNQKMILHPPYTVKLFSYNYTPLSDVAHQIDKNVAIIYYPVHGTVKDNSIIFGFHDDPKIPKEYRPIQKSMDENYKSSNIVSESLNADYIVFFGLSLGYIDGVYFKNLFEQISNLSNPQMINKKIIFITKDVGSENSIKNNLLDMGINLQLLYNSNNVDFIFTDDKQKSKTEHLFSDLLKKITPPISKEPTR